MPKARRPAAPPPTPVAVAPAEASAGGVPRYRQVLGALRQDILNGVYPGRLPSEPELAPRYGVSRMTLRRAISALVEEGYLDSRQGAGTFTLLPEDGETPRIVGLLVSPVIRLGDNDPYIRHLAHGLLEACASKGWTLRLAPTAEAMGIRLGAGRGAAVAACIAAAFGNDDVGQLQDLPVPLVLMDSEPLLGAPCILPDNLTGVRAAVGRLLSLGHRQIVHLAGHLTTPAGREREQAFREAMQDAGVPLRADAVKNGEFRLEAGYQAMAAWWSATPRPTAVVCANDRMAFGAMRWLLERGVKIPDEISVIGFDGIDAAEVMWPPLATVAVDYAAHARLVLKQVVNPGATGVIRSPVILVERRSLGAAPGR